MDLRKRLLRHRKDTRWILALLALTLLVLSAIYYFIQRTQDLPSDLATDRVVLFALSYVNLVLIFTFVFVLLRNLVKLAIERRHRLLGSKFKTKLLATYIFLSLVPVGLLYLYGTQLLQGWIDRWFEHSEVKQIVEQGHAVAEAFNERIQATQLRDGTRVLWEIRGIDLQDTAARPELARRFQLLLNDLDLDYLAVYDDTDFVHAVVRPQSGMSDLPEPADRFLLEALRNGKTGWMQPPPDAQGRLIMTAVAGDLADESTRPVVAIGTLLDAALAAQSDQLIQARQGYRQLEVRKSSIESTYKLAFLTVTLLILLATSWMGLYLARRVTVPIQALAEGTRRISEGDLDHRVQVEAEDELGVLVDSFNRMTTDLRVNKLEILAANQRLAAVLENVAAGVVSVNEDGVILTCNRAALRMLHHNDEETLGRPVADVWADSERSKLAALFEEDPGPSGRLARGLRLLLRGRWKTFEAKVRTMLDPDGNVQGRVMVLEDLTELLQAQQRAAWNEAARRVAHEIKNPLTPIKLSAERLLRKYRQNDPDLGTALEEGVEIISAEVEAMKAMVDEFSRFARMKPPQPTETDIEKLVGETLKLYEGLKPGVTVEADVEPAAAEAVVDGEQFRRVLINLLDNALEATEAPGNVSVAVHKDNGDLLVDVADTGEGIPEEALEKLFLPYFSTKGRGTGLGLSIVHRIVDEHQGVVRVEANEPKGTVFRVQLPQT